MFAKNKGRNEFVSNVFRVFRTESHVIMTDLHPMDSILKDHNKSINDLNKKWGEAMIKTLKDCLNLKPSQR